jgi:hypothetical protein
MHFLRMLNINMHRLLGSFAAPNGPMRAGVYFVVATEGHPLWYSDSQL